MKKMKDYEIGKDRNKDFKILTILVIFYCLIGIVIELWDGWYTIDSYVSTLFAFSYFNDGFIRRGLIGTIYSLIGKIFPFMMNWKSLFYFCYFVSALFVFFILRFIKYVFNKTSDNKAYKGTFMFCCFMLAFIIPNNFSCEGLLGYADLIQMSIGLLQIYLIIEHKYEFLTLPLTIMNVLFHEGYLCMTFNIIIMALVYRAIKNEKGHKAKYWVLFALNIVFMAIPAVISVFYTRAGSLENYNRTYELAKNFNYQGDIHYNLLNMMNNYSIPGSPSIPDADFVRYQKSELPVFLVCFIPVFVVAIRFVIKMFKELSGKKKGIYTTSLILGPAMIAFEFYKYCDYGRYVVWIFFYYLITYLMMMAMQDANINDTFAKYDKTSNLVFIIIIVIAILYQPIGVTYFSHLSRSIYFRLFN